MPACYNSQNPRSAGFFMKANLPASILSVALLFLAAGCATSPASSKTPATITVNTGEVQAHVKLISDGEPIVEGDTKGGVIAFEINRVGSDHVEVLAKAPGYDPEPGFVSDFMKRHGGEIRLHLREPVALRVAKHRAAIEQRRMDYVVQHAEKSEAIKAAIIAGNVLAGMSMEDVLASWGEPSTRNTSGGIGGEFVTWAYRSVHESLSSDLLFFSNRILVRWNFDR